MKTPEEIKKLKKGLASCASDECHGDHGECPYKDNVLCVLAIARESLAYIEQLEEQITLMKIQMHGDCGVCKHRSGCQINGRDITMSKTCYDCMQKESRPNWEYEGLPELTKKGES